MEMPLGSSQELAKRSIAPQRLLQRHVVPRRRERSPVCRTTSDPVRRVCRKTSVGRFRRLPQQQQQQHEQSIFMCHGMRIALPGLCRGHRSQVLSILHPVCLFGLAYGLLQRTGLGNAREIEVSRDYRVTLRTLYGQF